MVDQQLNAKLVDDSPPILSALAGIKPHSLYTIGKTFSHPSFDQMTVESIFALKGLR